MFKHILVLSLMLCCLGGAACSEKSATNTAQPAPTFAAPPPEPKVVYSQGFFDQEQNPDGSGWRWMGPEGVVRLKNTGHDMTLTLAGSSPTHTFKSPATIKLTFNGSPLDQFAGKAEGVEKQYEIPAAKLGSGEFSELRISSDKSMVPQEVDKTFQDSRRLAFSLGKLTWEEK